jgi:hypothetical protein
MKCGDIQQLFGVYWDLPDNDLKKQCVNEHIKHCPACAEEFQLWQESVELIKSAADKPMLPVNAPIASNVMKRIYADETWRVPVTDRIYAISYKMRRNFTAIIAFCLALFMFSFLYSIAYEQPAEKHAASSDSSVFGRIGDPVVVASGKSESLDVRSMPSAVASLKGFNEPFTYHVGPIHTYRDYLLALSLIGITSALLIMNWLSRTRS